MNNVVSIAKALSSEELAAAWVARIDAGRLTRKDREALLSWLAADPLHPALLDEHARAWAFAGSGRTPVIVPTRDLPRRRILAMAVAASVAVAIGHEVVHERSVYEGNYATVIGENKRIALPDGSLIKLNTATRLSVVFTRDRRRITLLAGEGLFEVAHDASRPFEVIAAGTVTRAIGTRFFVRRLSFKRVSVVVTEGRVELGPDRPREATTSDVARTPVSVGEQALVDLTTLAISRLARPDVERATGWASGGIAFRDESLSDVLTEVNRYSPSPISVADRRLGALRVSGYFAIGNVEGFLSGLAASSSLIATQPDGDRIILEQHKT